MNIKKMPRSFWMVDIESLSTKKPSIFQVGVCLYLDGEFYSSSAFCRPKDTDIDLDTVAWWSTQPNFENLINRANSIGRSSTSNALNVAIRYCLNSSPHNTVRISDDITKLPIVKDADWYFNPPGFDAVMLEKSLCENERLPWNRYQIKCFSTVKTLIGDFRNAVRDEVTGSPHDARYDAELQARALVKAMEAI